MAAKSSGSGPKAPFYIAVAVVVIGLLAFGGYRMFFSGGGGNGDGPNVVNGNDDDEFGAEDDITVAAESHHLEDPAVSGVTTVDEYEYIVQERLPEVKGAAAYAPMEDNTVRFALNVWAGWAPIIYANEGGAANKVWTTASGEEFKVELVLIDDPGAMLDTYAAGKVHIGWATVDMMPLFMERLVDKDGKPLDSRAMPRVYQQVDWSNGGDGIVVRSAIKNTTGLRGKTLALAENSPSHYFALNMLAMSGVQPREVKFKYTPDAFQAAAAFNNDKSIDACVSWAPDIYTLGESKGNKTLVTTATLNRLIADVWFARADFAEDHPEIVEALVRGIFDAMDELKDTEKKKECAALMADLYDIPEADTLEMFQDAYATGWGDNYQFFLNKNYLANFEHVWNNAYELYSNRQVGRISKPKVPFEEVVDFSLIQKLGEEQKYRAQKPSAPKFDYRKVSAAEAGDAPVTASYHIHFDANSWDLHKKILRRTPDGETIEENYDPNVDKQIDKIAAQIGQTDISRIVILGHTDSSMKGQVDEDLVRELSQNRADAVRDELIERFDLDRNRFSTEGVGWREPADTSDPNNHAKNRRVEVRILPAEG